MIVLVIDLGDAICPLSYLMQKQQLERDIVVVIESRTCGEEPIIGSGGKYDKDVTLKYF